MIHQAIFKKSCLTLLICALALQAQGQCNALHARVRAELTKGWSDPSVSIMMILLNDSAKPVDVSAGSWTLVVDGIPLKDSGMIFGNGPGPIGGFTTLQPGEHYELGKGLSINQYFLKRGKHTVSWKGAAFQSPTIVVQIP